MRHSSFLRFGVVGSVGFMVDGGILQALVVLAGWGPIEARVLSFPLAVLTTWILNDTIVFRGPRVRPVHHGLARYLAVSLVGAAINFIVYTSLVMASTRMAAYPILPLAVAAIIALLANYLGSKHFAFR